MTDYFENEELAYKEFDYKAFVKNLVVQVPDACGQEFSEIQKQYITTKLENYGVMAAEALANDTQEKWSIEQQKFMIQVIMEWTFHKQLDLYRAEISAEYYDNILQIIAFVVFEITKESYRRNLEQKTILQAIEHHVGKTYKKELDKLLEKNCLTEELYQKALQQSNIDIMAEKFKKDETAAGSNEEDNLESFDVLENLANKNIETYSSSDLVFNDEAKRALNKSYLNYYAQNICLVLGTMYLTTAIYFYLNGFDFSFSVVHKTVFQTLFKPNFLIGMFVVIGIKDLLKYIFCGFSTNENKYLKSVEDENPQVKGVKKIFSAESIKSRFGLLFGLFSILGLLIITLLIKNLFKIIGFVAIYCATSFWLKLPINDIKHIILSKEFLILFLVMYCISKKFSKKSPKDKPTNITEN